jgi:hypothetical protein
VSDLADQNLEVELARVGPGRDGMGWEGWVGKGWLGVAGIGVAGPEDVGWEQPESERSGGHCHALGIAIPLPTDIAVGI